MVNTDLTAHSLIDDRAIVPSDVVQDKVTHKPLQVVGIDPRRANQVPDVWDSTDNHEMFDIEPETTVFRCVYLPRGNRLEVPQSTQPFPAPRLRRVQAEAATDDRRVQAVVVRAVLSHMLADLQNRGHDNIATALLTELDALLPHEFVKSVRELAEASDYSVDTDD